MIPSKALLPITVQVSPWAAISGLILFTWSDSLFGSRVAIIATTLLIASLLVHEIGHMIAASISKVAVSAIGISAAGTYIRRQRAASPLAESVISLAGPIVSLALATLFALGTGHVYSWLAEMNLIVAISNLVPIAGTDGDRALNAICIASGGETGDHTQQASAFQSVWSGRFRWGTSSSQGQLNGLRFAGCASAPASRLSSSLWRAHELASAPPLPPG